MPEDEIRPSDTQEQPSDPPVESLLEELFCASEIRDPDEQKRRIGQVIEQIKQTAGEALPDEQREIPVDAFAEEWGFDPITARAQSSRSWVDHTTGTPLTKAQLPQMIAERKNRTINGEDARAFPPATMAETMLHLLPIFVVTATARELLRRFRNNR